MSDQLRAVAASAQTWFAGGERISNDPKARAIVTGGDAPLRIFLRHEGDPAQAVSFSNIKIREHYDARGLTERIKAALTTIAPPSQALTVQCGPRCSSRRVAATPRRRTRRRKADVELHQPGT
jgi:hypothetical protein